MPKPNQIQLGPSSLAVARCALIACVAGCGSPLTSSPTKDAAIDLPGTGDGTVALATSDVAMDASDAGDGATSSAPGDAIDAIDGSPPQMKCPGTPAPTLDRQPGALIKQHDHVHVVGDSYVNALWYAPLETMVANAKDDTGTVMSVTWTVNGVPGYAPATVYANRQSMIFDYDPDFLIIELGRNSTATDSTQLAADVEQLLIAILAWKPTIRLAWIGAMWANEIWTQVGAQPPTWNNVNGGDAIMAGVNTVIARVCAKYNVPYVDGRGFSLQYEPYYNPNKNPSGQSAAGPPNGLTSDGTHPNANGAQVMSQAMFNALSFSK